MGKLKRHPANIQPTKKKIMSDTLKSIANQINQKSKDFEIGQLQDLRKELKGLKKES